MTSRDKKGQGCDLNMLRAKYLENGWRKRLGSNGPPIGNGLLGFEWSRDRWRHDLEFSGSRYVISHVTHDVTWPRMVKVMTPIYLGPIISTIVGHMNLVRMEHL